MNEEDLESVKKCRDISSVIMNYGVSQKEILMIIRNLSLELEASHLMKEIINIIKQEEISKENKNNILI